MLVILSLCISAMLSSRSMLATVMWVHLLACCARAWLGACTCIYSLGQCVRMDDLLCTVAIVEQNTSVIAVACPARLDGLFRARARLAP